MGAEALCRWRRGVETAIGSGTWQRIQSKSSVAMSRGGSIMSKFRSSVFRYACLAAADQRRGFFPCLALAGALLFHPSAPSWAAPDDHNGERTVAAPAAKQTSNPALTGAIRDLASNAAALDQLIDFDATALQHLYAARDYQPIWVASSGLQPSGEALLSASERLERSGALPHSADVAAASARRGNGAIAGLAELELLLSSALITTAVDPEDLLAPGPRP